MKAIPASRRLKVRHSFCVLLALLPAQLAGATESQARVLRVCSDPNNLPFSNERGEGFENRLAELLAGELGASVEYTFWAQRRGFLRNTLKAGACDVVMGLPASMEGVGLTRPYYHSSYVFVSRAERKIRVRSLDDPRLRTLLIGVPVVGDDYANTPPAHALAARGLVQNVRGYSVYGNYAEASPPADLLRAVERGEIDVAIAWGPLAGFFAKHSTARLTIAPVRELRDGPHPLRFAIAVAVRKADEELRRELDRALERHKRAVHALLVGYGVPQI